MKSHRVKNYQNFVSFYYYLGEIITIVTADQITQLIEHRVQTQAKSLGLSLIEEIVLPL